MTTTPTNRYPVDSTYHPCCNAIGRHGRNCAGVAVSAQCDGVPSPQEGATMTTTPTEVDAPTVECRHTWCENPHTTAGTEHFYAAYTTATGRTERIPTTTGVALSYSPDDADTVPRLLVHTMSADGELDVDACLTVDEAIALRDLLDTAISHALGFEAVAR